MTDQLSSANQWAKDYAALLSLVISVVALLSSLGVFGYWGSRRSKAPALRFGRSDGVSEAIGVEIHNVGGGTAHDTRMTWKQRSSCEMAPVPQPVVIQPGERHPLDFKIEELELLLSESILGQPVLGCLEVTYRGLRRSSYRDGFCLLPSADGQSGGDLTSATLGPLPQRTISERFRLVDRVVRWITRPEVQEQRRIEAAQLSYEQDLARSRETLNDVGIDISERREDATRQLAGELGRRGWEWEYAPGGMGYEATARKTWPPSASYSISLEGKSPVEAFIRVLACAIEEDAWRAANGAYRTSRGVMYGDPE